MAGPNTVKSTELLVKVAIAGGSTYAHPCTINADRNFEITASTNSIPAVDCDNPQLPKWILRIVDTLEAGITGGGLTHKDDIIPYMDALTSGTPLSVIVEVGGTGGVAFTGNYIINKFGFAGSDGDFVKSDVSFESDGKITYAAIA